MAEGTEIEILSCDLSRRKEVDDALARSRVCADGIDALVACTASAGPPGSVLRTGDHEFVDATARNIAAVRVPVAAAARGMARNGGGSVLIVNSIAAERGLALDQAYASAKGALRTMARCMAIDLARYGIRVNSLLVGYLETDLSRQLYSTPDRRKAVVDRIPLGRLGTCGDLDGAVRFFISEDSAYVTGSDMVIDGGYSLT